MIGKTIFHYKIIEKIGAGGMGEVYLAEDDKLKRKIALKFLPPNQTLNEEAQERLKVEAQTAAGCNHPNIVTIHEINEFENQIFIAMEYVEGISLRKKITDAQVPVKEITEISLQICEGLRKAHCAGIIHRDIKPENILIDSEDRVKILDFGLAKLKDAGELNKDISTLGTIYYMSPEQAMGDEVGPGTDIWSLGVIMYELLTGSLPFKGDYEQAVIYSIINQEPEQITNLTDELPSRLEQIISKCLAKSKLDRYKDVNEVITDLKSIQDQSTALDIPFENQMEKNKPKIIVKNAILFILALLIIIIVNGYITYNKKQKQEPKVQFVAVLPFVNIRNDVETDFLSFALANQIIGGLTYSKSISVRPSSSIRKYLNQIVDVETVGKELEVDFVLTGNFLKEKENIRLDVELIDVKSNEIIWHELIEVLYDNTFKLQDIVSKKVINNLNIQFSDDDKHLQIDIPQNSLAYEYYLRSLSYPLSVDGHSFAIEMLKKSIQIDSTYAPAFVELGRRTNWYAIYGLKGKEECIKAEKYYLKALTLNSELLSALSNLAGLYNDIGKKEESMNLVQKALEINPNNAWSLFILSYNYRFAGMLAESEKIVEKVLSLDPKNPRFRSLVLTYIYLQKFDIAYDATEIDKGSTYSLTMKGIILLQQGKLDEAIEYFNQVLEIEPNGAMGLFATGYKTYIGNNKEEGLRTLHFWEQTEPYNAENLYFLASTYGLFKDEVGCIRALRKAVDSGFFNYPFMLIDPFLDSVRDNPEFQDVLNSAKEKHEAFKEMYFSNK